MFDSKLSHDGKAASYKVRGQKSQKMIFCTFFVSISFIMDFTLLIFLIDNAGN